MAYRFRNNQSGDTHHIELISKIDQHAFVIKEIALRFSERDRERARDAIDRVILVIMGMRDVNTLKTHENWTQRIRNRGIAELESELIQDAIEFSAEFHGTEDRNDTILQAVRNLPSTRSVDPLRRAVIGAFRTLGSHGATQNTIQNQLRIAVADMGLYVAELKIPPKAENI